MRKLIIVLLISLLPFLSFTETFSEAFSANTLETSLQESTAHSSENSTQTSSNESSNSTSLDQTNLSPESVFTVELLVAGAIIGIAITGIVITVDAMAVQRYSVIDLQDQIYLASGKDFETLVSYFDIEKETLVQINDELVLAGHNLENNQEAADYLALLVLKLSQRSEKFQKILE